MVLFDGVVQVLVGAQWAALWHLFPFLQGLEGSRISSVLSTWIARGEKL